MSDFDEKLLLKFSRTLSNYLKKNKGEKNEMLFFQFIRKNNCSLYKIKKVTFPIKLITYEDLEFGTIQGTIEDITAQTNINTI